MLGKLIKHEWKDTCKMGYLMLFGVALVTALGWLSFQTPMWKSLSSNHFSFGWVDIFGFFTLLMYVLLLVGVHYGLLIYLAVHFYKTMYTDEGYLTHTLPASAHQILGAKILVSSLWVLFETLALTASMLILGVTLISAVLPDGLTFSRLWEELGYYSGEIFRDLGIDTAVWFARTVVYTLFSAFTSMMVLFGAITLGQLFSRYRVLMAILCYIGIVIVESMFGTLFSSILFSVGSHMDTSLDISFVVNLVFAVLLYILSYYINTHKLNLQ